MTTILFTRASPSDHTEPSVTSYSSCTAWWTRRGCHKGSATRGSETLASRHIPPHLGVLYGRKKERGTREGRGGGRT